MLQCDAVFEGGGVKGIGLVGAAMEMEKAGYHFVNLAGTSAGAILCALLAVGYSAEEIAGELAEVDYLKFRQEDALSKWGFPGKLINLVMDLGIYRADYFEQWLEELLKRKGKTTFGQIRRPGESDRRYMYRFLAIASDITDGELLILPNDLVDFGFDPDAFPIARAVRMSMGIPFFFEPFVMADSTGKKHVIVDGGVLSNYPVWLLDDGTSDPPWPTFGFKFDSQGKIGPLAQGKSDIVHFTASLVSTMLNAHDRYHISVSKGDFARSILIPTTVKSEDGFVQVSSTDFDLKRNISRGLLENGRTAAKEFLARWDFHAWKKQYRSGQRE